MKTITHIFITHAVLIVLFGGAALALAQDPAAATSSDRRAETQATLEERQQAAQEKRTELQENAADRRARLQERTQERIVNLAANVSNRMDAAIARLQNITDRLESRIQKLDDLGVDTTEATAALVAAQEAIDDATEKLATIDEDVAAVVGAEDVRTAWTEAKNIFTTVREDLKTARTELQEAVAALKEAVAAAELGNGVSEAVRNNASPEDSDTETAE